MASGEFTVLLDHDDELAPLALYYVAKEINAYPEAQMIYSDEDLIDTRGVRTAGNRRIPPADDLALVEVLRLERVVEVVHRELVADDVEQPEQAAGGRLCGDMFHLTLTDAYPVVGRIEGADDPGVFW